MSKLYSYSDEEAALVKPESNVVGEALNTYNPKAAKLRKTAEKTVTVDKDGKKIKETKVGKGYPTSIVSYFEWVAEKVQSGKHYYELFPVAMGEFLAPMIINLPIMWVANQIRAESGMVTSMHRLMPIFLMALVFGTIGHYLLGIYSCDCSPMLSLARFLLPDSYSFPRKYKYGKSKNWSMNVFVLITKLVAGALGSFFAFIVLTQSEITGNLGFPDAGPFYSSGNFPYWFGTTGTAHVRDGSLLFIALFVFTLVFCSIQLEYIQIGKPSIKSLYIGFAYAAVYLLTYTATSTPINTWMTVSAIVYHGTTPSHPNVNLVGVFIVPLVAALIGVAAWFFGRRLTSTAVVKSEKQME